MTKFKNQEEWRMGRRWDDDLAATLKMYGFVYPDGGWIELRMDGCWNVLISNTEERFGTLYAAENHLWTYHSAYHVESPRDVMIEELAQYCSQCNLPKLSADELLVDCTIKRQRFENHEKWLSDYCRRWDLLKD